jgi:hypothetical protein
VVPARLIARGVRSGVALRNARLRTVLIARNILAKHWKRSMKI